MLSLTIGGGSRIVRGMAKPTDPAVLMLTELLGTKPSPQTLARLVAAVIDLGSEGLAALRRAAKGSKARARRRCDVMLALGDAAPGDPADGEIREVLAAPADPTRDAMLQVMKLHPARARFIADLREVARQREDPGWAWAVDALGELGDSGGIEILLAHAAGHSTPFVLLDALRKLRHPEAAVVFEANLTHPEPRTRVFALWGLAAIGFETPLAPLVALLDDPDIRTATSSTPGQARRAAQALCDLHHWPFEWNPEAVEATRARVRDQFAERPDYLAACAEAFNRGQFSLSSAADGG